MSLSKIVAMTTVTYHPYSLEDALKGISGAGFRYVELGAIPGVCEHISVDIEESSIKSLSRKLKQYGLSVSGLNSNSSLMTIDDVEFTKKAISLAPRLDTGIVICTIGASANPREDISQIMANIIEVAEHAKKEGVVIGLEIFGEIMATGKMSVDLVRKINHPNVKITYDTANCIYYGDTWPYEDLRVAVPETVYVHLKDKVGGKKIWSFPSIGMGEVDFEKVLNILDDEGFQGPLCVEIEFDGKGWPSVAEVDKAVITAHRNLMHLLQPHW